MTPARHRKKMLQNWKKRKHLISKVYDKKKNKSQNLKYTSNANIKSYQVSVFFKVIYISSVTQMFRSGRGVGAGSMETNDVREVNVRM